MEVRRGQSHSGYEQRFEMCSGTGPVVDCSLGFIWNVWGKTK